MSPSSRKVNKVILLLIPKDFLQRTATICCWRVSEAVTPKPHGAVMMSVGSAAGDPNPLSDWVGQENGPTPPVLHVLLCLVIMGHFFCIRDIVNIKVILLANEGLFFYITILLNECSTFRPKYDLMSDASRI